MEKKLETYKIKVNKDDKTGVPRISLVENPAIEVNFIAFNKQENFAVKLPPCHENCRCEIDEEGYWNVNPDGVTEKGNPSPCDFCLSQKKKYDNARGRQRSRFSSDVEKKRVAGPFLIPDMEIYRYDEKTGKEFNVVFDKDTIELIREKFMVDNLNLSFNYEHTEKMVNSVLLESWIVEDPKNDKSNKWGYELPVGTWFGVLQILDDDFWSKNVKSGDVKGFSVELLAGLEMSHFNIITDGDKKIKDANMEENKTFATAKLVDGTMIEVSEMIVGAEIYVVDAEGNKTPAPDGEHTLENGQVIVVAEGKITEIKEVEQPEAEVEDEELKSEFSLTPNHLETIKNSLGFEALLSRIEKLEAINVELSKQLDESKAKNVELEEKFSKVGVEFKTIKIDSKFKTEEKDKFNRELNKLIEIKKFRNQK